MEQGKWLLIIGGLWFVICLYFAAIGGKHLNKPHAKFEKVPILFGISVAGLLGLLAIIGYLYFE